MLNDSLPGPKFVQLFWPVIAALKELGGSARPAEVREEVAKLIDISDVERADLLDSGASRFDNLVAWARFYLVKAGYIDSSQRGVWALSDEGYAKEGGSHDEALRLFKSIHDSFKTEEYEEDDLEEEEEPAPLDNRVSNLGYQEELLAILQALPPDGFERFCQRLLREANFQEVTVTGRTGDGGIDGIGILQVNPLVSFKVLFQCKRYKGSVSPSQVRDFRGAMQGRADKGIIITTGTFTSEAKREAVRDGVPPIELVDGEKLLEMLRDLELGVRPVQSYEVDKGFFDIYQKKEDNLGPRSRYQ